MRPENADLGWLWDMLMAARYVTEFIQERTLEDYQTNALLRSAVERQIEIMGEAAGRVSAEFQNTHPEIEWRKIIGQRHILAHGYGKVDHELVWLVATVHVPVLVSQLASLVPTSTDIPPHS